MMSNTEPSRSKVGAVNWIRIIIVGAVMGLVGHLSPDFVKWGFLGAVLTMLAIKIEEQL